VKEPGSSRNAATGEPRCVAYGPFGRFAPMQPAVLSRSIVLNVDAWRIKRYKSVVFSQLRRLLRFDRADNNARSERLPLDNVHEQIYGVVDAAGARAQRTSVPAHALELAADGRAVLFPKRIAVRASESVRGPLAARSVET
jgi:hypothetical protein